MKCGHKSQEAAHEKINEGAPLVEDVINREREEGGTKTIVLADDVVLFGSNEVDMTEYLESWGKALEERGMRVSRPKTQWMESRFEQAEKVDQQTVKI